MLPKQPYGRRLRTLVARLLRKSHTRTYAQLGKCVIEHAIAVEVDFLAIACLEEAKFAGWIKPPDSSDRRAFMMFHLALRAANLIL